MIIQQPESGTKLPKELQDDIDKARSNLIILQADGASYNGIKASLERDIIQSKKDLNFSEELVAELEKTKQTLNDDIALLKKEKAEFEQGKEARDLEIVNENKKIEAKVISLESREHKITIREQAIYDEATRVSDKKKLLDSREKEIEIKEAKIKELVKTL